MRIKRLLVYLPVVFFLLSPVENIAQQVNADKLKEHVYILASDSLMGRGFGTKGGRMATDYIARNFEAIGLKPWKGSFQHPFISPGMMLKTEGVNIIGWVEGSDSSLKNEFIVLGAHYDHIAYKQVKGKTVVYNGADDNASGVASVIEIGRWLVQNKQDLKRSVILIAFDGEEAGLIGSSHLVSQDIVPVKSIKFMFSLDMVGMLKKYGGIDLVGNKTLSHGDEFFATLAEKHDIKVKKTGRKIEMQTDTQPFGSVGIPAVHVFTSTVSPYHKPEDDADKLDYEGMARIASFVADATTQLANAFEVRPDVQFAMQTAKKGILSIYYQLGFGDTYHDYRDEFFNSKPGFSFNTGVSTSIGLSRAMDFQIGLQYQTIGTQHLYGSYRSHELLIPANFCMYFGGKERPMVSPKLYLIGGGFYSYRFAGKIGNGSFNLDNAFYKEAYGLQFGVGFNIMSLNFQVVQHYNVNSIARHANVIPRTLYFNLGFKLK